MVPAGPRIRSGFSLIEVMMATTILLVGFIGMIQAVTIGSESLDTARKQQVANQIVMAEIEKLRGGEWSAVASLPASGRITISSAGVISGDSSNFALANHTADTSDDDTDLCASARSFTCAFVRTYLRPSAAAASTVTYLKLVYTVGWKTNTGRQQSHQYEAYFGENGLHLSYQRS